MQNKIIHQIWFNFGNGIDVPEKYKAYQKSWIKYHPNWEYILWNEEMGDELIKNKYNKYYEAYKNVKYPIMKVDILRYCILHQYGGMYADIDYKCLNSFDDYLDNNEHIIFLNEQPNATYNAIFGRTVSNSLLISTKSNHPFWEKVINECFKRIMSYIISYHIYYVLMTTGPGLINDILYELNKINNNKYIHLLPYDQFNYCNDCSRCKPSSTKKLYAVHDYASYWNSNTWLNIRKIFSCGDFNDMLTFIIIIIILCYFLNKRL